MLQRHKIPLPALFLFPLLYFSCSKYLDEKPDQTLEVPTTVQDCQAILDNNYYINQFQNNGIGEASADNYYLTDADWSALYYQSDKSIYIWGDEIFYNNPPGSNDWSKIYGIVYKANVVLETLNTIARTTQNQASWDNVKGSSFFLRAWAFHIIATNFANAYDSATATTDLGIPLRLNSDFNEVSTRSSLQQTYFQIIQDLQSAIPLLPVTPVQVMRPSKPAAYALLARVYLSMRNYSQSALYADSSLQLNSSLMDYNNDPNVNPTSSSIGRFNQETLFYASAAEALLLNIRAKVDSNLFNSYAANDYRKTIFFQNNGDTTYGFKGNYTSSIALFVGIATDEMYLTKAECIARQGNLSGAMDILNALLIKRWITGTFIPYTANSQDSALSIILTERRKELLMRDLRWMDIKRLNKEGAGLSPSRFVLGETYQLLPNDPRFALPLPAYIIQQTGMQQNQR